MNRLVCVIVNYNSAALVADCVASLEDPSAQIIVVDNNSSDRAETSALAEIALADSRVEVHHLLDNNGFGAGVNYGIRASQASAEDVVWIVNPDSRAHPGAGDALIAALQVGAADFVSPIIWTGSSSDAPVLWFAGGSVDTRAGRVKHSHAAPPRGDTRVLPTDFLSGASIAAHMSTWRRIGPLREDLFMYWEDVELSLRARHHGFSLGVVPTAEVWHLEGGSSAKQGRSELYYRYNNRNRIALRTVWGRQSSPFVGLGLLVTLGMLSTPLRRETQGRFRKSRAALLGAIAGARMSIADQNAVPGRG